MIITITFQIPSYLLYYRQSIQCRLDTYLNATLHYIITNLAGIYAYGFKTLTDTYNNSLSYLGVGYFEL